MRQAEIVARRRKWKPEEKAERPGPTCLQCSQLLPISRQFLPTLMCFPCRAVMLNNDVWRRQCRCVRAGEPARGERGGGTSRVFEFV